MRQLTRYVTLLTSMIPFMRRSFSLPGVARGGGVVGSVVRQRERLVRESYKDKDSATSFVAMQGSGCEAPRS